MKTVESKAWIWMPWVDEDSQRYVNKKISFLGMLFLQVL